MDIINPNICAKHQKEARFMCTRLACFQQQDILVCPECFPNHKGHQNELIQTNQLNEKVHQLMKKRMNFEQTFEAACDGLIREFKKFKLFKIEMMNILNHKERLLNQLCKKLKRNIPYEKDKNLFKKSLNYVYLAMRGINPNYDLHKKFQLMVKETLNECRKALCKLEVNASIIPLFEKKDQQICSILKKTKQQPIDQLHFQQPCFKQFKKQTLKFSKQQQEYQSDSKLFRLSNQDFLTYNNKCHFLKWYNTDCFLLPKAMYVGGGIQHLTLLGKNVFLTQKGGRMAIYDLLNQKILKQYASTNHKTAQICSVLSLDCQTLLNFVTSPNQIVTLKFSQETEKLKMIKGIQTHAKCTNSLLVKDSFVTAFEDKSISIYNTEMFQQQRMIQTSGIIRKISLLDNNTFVVGGEEKKISLIDKRSAKVTLSIPTVEPVEDLKKIYPSSILYSAGKHLKIFDLKVQKQLFSNKVDEMASGLQILSSDSFVASGRNLHLWKGIN